MRLVTLYTVLFLLLSRSVSGAEHARQRTLRSNLSSLEVVYSSESKAFGSPEYEPPPNYELWRVARIGKRPNTSVVSVRSESKRASNQPNNAMTDFQYRQTFSEFSRAAVKTISTIELNGQAIKVREVAHVQAEIATAEIDVGDFTLAFQLVSDTRIAFDRDLPIFMRFLHSITIAGGKRK